jgi:16S rRNA (guanine966-N2)-methyltransferase
MKIIAGKYRGRQLLPPPGGSVTRPITALAKKSLFDHLGPWLEGARVVDLYCGTGTMALEAISRGAAHCWLAELDRRVIARLQRNIEACGAADQCTIWAGDVQRRLTGWLAGLGEPIDLAFVDPPYEQARQWDFSLVGPRLFAPLAKAMAEGSRLVLRTPGGVEVPKQLAGLTADRRRSYGNMHITILVKQAPAPAAGPEADIG